MTSAEWQACDDPAAAVRLLFAHGRANPRNMRLWLAACCRMLLPHIADNCLRKAVMLAEQLADGRSSSEAVTEAWIAVDSMLATWANSVRVYIDTRDELWLSSSSLKDAIITPAVNALAALTSSELSLECALRGAAHLASTLHRITQWTGTRQTFARARPSWDHIRVAECSAALSAPPRYPAVEEAVAALTAQAEAEAKRQLLAPLQDIFGDPFQPRISFATETLCWHNATVVALAQAAYQLRTPPGALDNERLAILADALEEAGCTHAEALMHLRSDTEHWRGCYVVAAILGR